MAIHRSSAYGRGEALIKGKEGREHEDPRC